MFIFQECSQTTSKELLEFLALPVDRVTEYRDFLEFLSINTWPGHEDYIVLKDSLEKFEEILLSIDKKRLADENIAKLQEIEKRFAGKHEVNSPSIYQEYVVTFASKF